MKNILITGATAGIGRHAALHLARRGHRVFATGRKQEALASLAAESQGLPLETLRLDVCDPASIEEARAEVARRTNGHGVDVLINNAGYGLAAPLAEMRDADLRAQFETNVFGVMAVTRAFLPPMMERGVGRVINVSSIGGRVTFPLFGAYHASKYALEALSDALRNEVAPFGVRVVLVEPGPVRTNFADTSLASVQPYRTATSAYGPVFALAEQIQRQADAMAVGPESTSRVLERAVSSRRPPARYVVPFSSGLMLWAMRLLPTPVLDALMRRFMGLLPGRLRRAAPAEAEVRLAA